MIYRGFGTLHIITLGLHTVPNNGQYILVHTLF